MNYRSLSFFTCTFMLFAGLARSAPTLETVVGEITAVDPGARTITLRSDDGRTVSASVPADASVLRAKAGATSLNDAVSASLDEAAVGDRAIVRGATAAGASAMTARRVVLMSRQEIDRKHAADKEDWQKRGILGAVTSVDAANGRILVRLGRRTGAPEITVATSGRPVVFRRYAPDSVRFADARPSELSAIRPGDELRAKGERSADGGTLQAEEVVFGTFHVSAGPVVSVDPEHGRLAIREEESGRPLTVGVGPDANLRRLPPELAARLAHRWGAPERASSEDLVQKMPPVALADIKVGQRVMISSTEGAEPGRVNAIVLVTGLEALQAPSGPRRGGRGADIGLPAEMMDMGMGMQ